MPLLWGDAHVSQRGDESPAFQLPVGTVTFMLTDIAGSTRLWEADGEGAARSVSRHYELIDEAVARAGGVRPVEQGEGDSVVAAFSRASDAVRAALDIQSAMARETWPPGVALRVRIGLHTGEAQLRDEGNYFGAAIARCARLRSIGHGGQTLISQATKDLVVDALPEGAHLVDLGVHRLRDLARAEHVYQLTPAGLEADFPPLTSLDAMPNNLPVHLTSFIGRETEMATLHGMLAENRLVTMTGSGGCGKTRLALQVAADLLEANPDGVWWIDLAPVQDGDLVAAAVAAAIGIREVPLQSFTETLKRQLHGRRMLVVLDNCEHLVAGSAALSEALLTSCPGISILATSREPLGVSGEATWRVPSLSLPPERTPPSIERLTQCEAVRLFVDRAVKARPNFAVTNDNAPAVSDICHRLDGIPLAIELAAARTRFLTPDQIAAGLADRFLLLTGGSRTALPRQQTLENSVDWSYALLEDDERTLLSRLSVFAGGFDLDAAEDVASDDGLDRLRVLDVLSMLVDRSLVQVEENGRASRYRLLETIRFYGRQKLVASGDAAAVRTRHLNHFLALAQRGEREMEGAGLHGWADRLETEFDNLRAAMEWSIESADVDRALRLHGAQLQLWLVRGHTNEGHERILAALELPGGEPRARAECLIAAGGLASWLLDAAECHRYSEEAVAIGRALDDKRILGRALNYLGWAATLAGPAGARSVFEEAVTSADAAGDSWYAAQTRVAWGFMEIGAGDLVRARGLLDEGISISKRNGDALNTREGLTYLGFAAIFQGRFEEAEQIADEATIILEELKDDFFGVLVRSMRGFAAVFRGEYERARSTLADALEMARDQGNVAGITTAVTWLGFLEYVCGDIDTAEPYLAEAILFLRALDFKLPLTQAMIASGAIEAIRERPDKAIATLEEAIEISRTAELPQMLARGLLAKAKLQRADGDLDACEHSIQEAIAGAAASNDEVGLTEALEALGGVAAAKESSEEAMRLFGAASAIRDRLGYLRFPIDRPQYDADLALARSAMNAEASDRAWTAGAALSPAEATAYARRARGERKRPSRGWESLTPTELDVVRFAAQGLTNPQIAERLFISRGTVKVHLSHVFSKLGFTTRSELAAEAVRRGL